MTTLQKAKDGRVAGEEKKEQAILWRTGAQGERWWRRKEEDLSNFSFSSERISMLETLLVCFVLWSCSVC